MKKILIIGVTIMLNSIAFGQIPKEIIARVYAAQQKLKKASYTVKRTDTLVTGNTRILTGSAKVRKDDTDSNFGFQFWCTQDGTDVETVYNGHIAYEANNNTKTYALKSTTSDITHLTSSYGGRIILTDLVKLDTSKAIGFAVSQDIQYYYLTIKYADYKPEDVTNRRKIVTIDKKTMLPMAMRSHQETLGSVQDLYYLITSIQINEPGFDYDFTTPAFLTAYKQQMPNNSTNKNPVFSLAGNPAPYFQLNTFTNKKVSTDDFKGKVVLLDFWEVWCGPCIESMPKVEKLYEKYKDKGLLVYGITNDIKQLTPSKLMVQKKNIAIPMLIGNEQLKQAYKVNSIPLYILINKLGKVSLVSEGFITDIEAAIQLALAE